MIKLPCTLQFRILKQAIIALFKGPYTAKFPYQPHEPEKRFRGKPKFYQDDCVGCTACAQVCPAKAITFKDEIKDGRPVRKLLLRLDICIFCGQCELNCLSEKGIRLSREFDFSSQTRDTLRQEIEKELVLCQDCGSVIVPADQISWVGKKLGPLAFSNTSVMVFNLKRNNLIVDTEKSSSEAKEFKAERSDRLKVLCPKCRRKAVLAS